MTFSMEDAPGNDGFPEGAVILCREPLAGVSPEEMREIALAAGTVQELADTFVSVWNQYGWIEDDLYDYPEGTEEYERFRTVVRAWGDLRAELLERVMEAAKKERLLVKEGNLGLIRRLEPFMKKYGYRDGRGWWVREDT